MSTDNDSSAYVLGQKYAFATASLIMGIASYVNLLGMEKGAVAILFAWLALRSSPGPVLAERRRWAQTGLALGAALWIIVAVLLAWKWDRVSDFLLRLQDLKK
jgi:hypothetical protein